MTPIISASILAANLAKLGKECSEVIDAGANWIHFDVMDNHYVPNLTFGANICQALVDYGIQAPIDVHLMVRPVDELIIKFAKAGAKRITIHPESTDHLDRSLNLILSLGLKAGVALNPSTPIEHLKYVDHLIDMVLVMSVNPGFGGQKLIQKATQKIKDVHDVYPNLMIQVDGGVTPANVKDLASAGAKCFVAGSAIFDQTDRKQAIQNFRNQL